VSGIGAKAGIGPAAAQSSLRPSQHRPNLRHRSAHRLYIGGETPAVAPAEPEPWVDYSDGRGRRRKRQRYSTEERDERQFRDFRNRENLRRRAERLWHHPGADEAY
jgi:hypothetical protein